jgi:ribonuclease HII
MYLIGIDEAGRGALAGPVAVGLCAISLGGDLEWAQTVKDSKVLSKKKRDEWFKTIVQHIEQTHSNYTLIKKVELIPSHYIDMYGITAAVQLGIDNVLKGFEDMCTIMLDGSLQAPPRFRDQTTIIKGDSLIPIISLAAISAKVTRDAHMDDISKDYPSYDFHIHKGYGTLKHRTSIIKNGLTDIHRKTFCKKYIYKYLTL